MHWALNHDWKKVTAMNGLKQGDICVSGPSATDIDHVYCFVDYIDSNIAHIFDNQAVGIHSRSLVGDHDHSPWRFALSMP